MEKSMADQQLYSVVKSSIIVEHTTLIAPNPYHIIKIHGGVKIRLLK
jgi:hypothetical protein